MSNNLTLHLIELEEELAKVSRRKVITKIRMETNETDTKKTIKKDEWNCELVFWKDKIDKPLVRLTKKKQRERLK